MKDNLNKIIGIMENQGKVLKDVQKMFESIKSNLSEEQIREFEEKVAQASGDISQLTGFIKKNK